MSRVQPRRSTGLLAGCGVLGLAACSGVVVLEAGTTGSGGTTGGTVSSTSTSTATTNTNAGAGGVGGSTTVASSSSTTASSSSTAASSSSTTASSSSSTASSSASSASGSLDAGVWLVTVTNSGSTNAPGFSVTAAPYGGATWHLDPPKNQPNPLFCSSPDGTTNLDTALTTKLFADLDAAAPFAGLQFDNCAKSISFGTWTSVVYGGAMIHDVECGSSTDPRAEALTVDVGELETAVSALCQ